MIHEQIQYIEFLSNDFTRIKKFYAQAFGWEFTDYGSDYIAFAGQCVAGGFAIGEAKQGSVLVILYSNTLEDTKTKVAEVGGSIVKDIFSFPGGRRFHFADPDGNELAVWSDT
jgi:predicted enzyme related to lactoylglutathione lyase